MKDLTELQDKYGVQDSVQGDVQDVEVVEPEVVTKRKLTDKEKKFVKVYAETLNQTEAASQAYNTKNRKVASVMGTETLAKPSVRAAADKLMMAIDNAITPEKIAEVHKEGLEASDKIIVDGEEIGSKPDYKTRHKYLDTYYKIKGKMNQTGTGGNTFVFPVADLRDKYSAN